MRATESVTGSSAARKANKKIVGAREEFYVSRQQRRILVDDGLKFEMFYT